MYHAIVQRNVRQTFRRLNTGDYEAALKQFAPDVRFSFAGTHALGGARDGVGAVRQWFQQFYQYFRRVHFESHDVAAISGRRTMGTPCCAVRFPAEPIRILGGRL